MGNSNSSTSSPPPPLTKDTSPVDDDVASDLPSFKPLKPQDRATTFDDRVHMTHPPRLGGQHDFKPLERAKTFDSRSQESSSHHPLHSVKDVLYRRHFNAKIARPSSKIPTLVHNTKIEPRQVVIVVDPMSTGQALAQKLIDRGTGVIAVYSDTSEILKEFMAHIPPSLTREFIASIFHPACLENALSITQGALEALGMSSRIVAVLPGAETGVLLADALSSELGLRSNGLCQSLARRNKYAMGERIRESGLRAVKQCSALIWADVEAFIEREILARSSSSSCEFQVIVKPEESAGSEDVFLCTTMAEVQAAFGTIQGKVNNLGLENTKVLVQEYLDGTEYVVDTVSRDGQHKIVAIWGTYTRCCICP